MSAWGVDLIEPCHMKVYDLEEIGVDPSSSVYGSRGRFRAFVYWSHTEGSVGAGDTVAKAISQAYAKRCNLWLAEPGGEWRPAVIDPQELIETSRWSNLWLAIPFVLFLALLFAAWRLA